MPAKAAIAASTSRSKSASARGHSYRVSYTIGDQRDNTPEHLSAASPRPQNTNDLDAWEGPGDNDIRHRFVGSFIADLPLGRNVILRDWLVASILTAHTGRPFTVTQGSLEGAGWVPNRVADTEGPKTVDQWFNVSDFQVVPAGTFGNAGRNILRGPGWFTVDFSLQRRIVMNDTLAATAALRRLQRDQPHELRKSKRRRHGRQSRDDHDTRRRSALDAVLRASGVLM